VLPKVPGYSAQGHRQDHERRSGVELGIRALPAGLHPANSPKSSKSSGRQPLPVRPAGIGRRLEEPTQRPAATGYDCFPRGIRASSDPHCRKESHRGQAAALVGSAG
jgi:hypothetical protein